MATDVGLHNVAWRTQKHGDRYARSGGSTAGASTL
jgi:hypothetical protein